MRAPRTIVACLLASALLSLQGCPEEVREPPAGDAGMACATDDDCNAEKPCGALRSCIHNVCSLEPTRYIPCSAQ